MRPRIMIITVFVISFKLLVSLVQNKRQMAPDSDQKLIIWRFAQKHNYEPESKARAHLTESIFRSEGQMVLMVPIVHFTMILLKNSVLMRLQHIQMSTILLLMITNQQFPMELNALPNVVVTISPLAIVNGRRKIFAKDGMKLGASVMAAWGRYQVS